MSSHIGAANAMKDSPPRSNFARRALRWLASKSSSPQVNEVLASPTRLSAPSEGTMDRGLILQTCRDNYRRSADYGRGLPDFGNRWGIFKQEMSTRIMNFASVEEPLEFAQFRFNLNHPVKDSKVKTP